MSVETYTARMTAQAQELVAKLMPLLTQADDLRIKIDNPICGKPGKGFKAARKLKPQLQALDVQIATVQTEIALFIRPSKKMSLTDAERRSQFIKAAQLEWGT